MGRGRCYIVILVAEYLAGVALSLTNCPEMTEETTTCESVKSWLCDYHEWATTMKEWKDVIEQDCSEEDLGTEWHDLFSCSEPDFNVTVECKNETAKHCEKDDLDCTVCHCTDGKYKNRQNHFALWRKHQISWRKTLQLYNEKLKNCGGESDACSNGEDTTEPTGTPATEPYMTTAAVTEPYMTTAAVTEPEMTTAAATEPEMTTPDLCEWLSYDGKCYFVVEPQSRLDKSDATDLCRQNGAELADILSAEHYNVTYSYVLSNHLTETTVFLWVANTYDFSREDKVIKTDGGAFQVPLWYYSGKPAPTATDRTSMQILIQHAPGGFAAALPSYTATPFCVEG